MSKLQEKPSALKKRTSSTSKNEIYDLFSMFVGNFSNPDPDTDPGTPLNLDPQHCY
jgi:hypothetical protein